MKRSIGPILTLALTAAALVVSPAAAQGTFGSQPKQTWNSGGSAGASTSRPASAYGAGSSYGAPTGSASRTGGQQRIYSPPEPTKAEGFEPYKPFSAGSTYASPYGANKAKGAKDCERSVYVNACGR